MPFSVQFLTWRHLSKCLHRLSALHQSFDVTDRNLDELWVVDSTEFFAEMVAVFEGLCNSLGARSWVRTGSPEVPMEG